MQRFGIAVALREARVTYEPGWEDLLSIDPICCEIVKSTLQQSEYICLFLILISDGVLQSLTCLVLNHLS